MSQTDIVLVHRGQAPPDQPPVRYVHTRWPSPAQMLANGAVGAMALVAFGLLIGGFTGRIDIESPVVPVAVIVLYALAWAAWIARQRGDSNAVASEDPR